MADHLDGVVVSYNDDRGFGFIRADDPDGVEHFVRWTEIRTSAGFRTLEVGARVRFEPHVDATTGDRQALDVRALA